MPVAIQEENVEEKTKLINIPGNIFYLIRTKNEHAVSFGMYSNSIKLNLGDVSIIYEL